MNPGILIGAGFLLGSVGVKTLTSKKAKEVYVKGIVQGMRVKEEVETMVDEARAEFDDLLAEAGYAKENEAAEEGACALKSDETALEPKEDSSAGGSAEEAKNVTGGAAKPAAKGPGKGAGHGGYGHGRGGR
ncbi:MAG: DUF6110 family protein [Eggerthellaceae bacterium]